MYLAKVELKNIRGIVRLTWAPPTETLPGWHVVLGNNGAGKSSLLRAMSLALVGESEAAGLRQAWDAWLRQGATSGSIDLALAADPAWDSAPNKPGLGGAALSLMFYTRTRGTEKPSVILDTDRKKSKDGVFAWGSAIGWFSAAYGPFRRLGTGEDEYQSLPRLARHVSLFDERVTFIEALKWLKYLKFQQLERSNGRGRTARPAAPELFDQVRQFVNQAGLLPDGVRFLDANSDDVVFEDARGAKVRIEELGDGFRSILSLTFDLIRQLASAFPSAALFSGTQSVAVQPPGVVLIDEIDAHLHPRWQRDIGFWFRQHFPNIQFIVTTHSPLVCQAAKEGSVFLLPRAGGDEVPRMLAGEELDRLLYGNILDAYATEPFAKSAERSPVAKERRKRLADLNVKELRKGLSAAERREQNKLRAAMPTAATTTRASAD